MNRSRIRHRIVNRFGLLRHAETIWNREKRIQGHFDSPLTPEGKDEARKWGSCLASFKWDRIITSDLGRAVETANFVNLSLNLTVDQDHRLREQNWGRWEGKNMQEVNEKLDPKTLEGGWEFRPPDGEARKRVRDRCLTALIEVALRWPGETILVITHEGVIRCLIYGLAGRKYTRTEPPMLRPNHLHFICHDGNGLKIEKINAMAMT
jgi:probable phosphoglycerate mutase